MSITVISVLIAVVVLIAWATNRPESGSREAKLLDLDNVEHIDIGEVESRCKLAGEGAFVVKTFRQSGNQHQEDRVFSDPRSAVRAAVTTFRRAKIDLVVVMDNSEAEFSFKRSVPDFRGSNEGKKVRWIEIHRVNTTTQPGGNEA